MGAAQLQTFQAHKVTQATNPLARFKMAGKAILAAQALANMGASVGAEESGMPVRQTSFV